MTYLSKEEVTEQFGEIVNAAYKRGWQDCLAAMREHMIKISGDISEMKLRMPGPEIFNGPHGRTDK